MTHPLYRLLDNPLVYNIAQSILAPGEKYFLDRYFQTLSLKNNGLVLDVGCGPQLYTQAPQSSVLGVDIHFDYVRSFAAKAQRLGVVSQAQKLPFKDNSFQQSRCFGLLHHLPEMIAVDIVREMVRCTKEGGDVIVLDNVWPKAALSRPVAWLLRKLDRGNFIRRESDLFNLISQAHPGQWMARRFTYTFLGHEALGMHLVKKVNVPAHVS